MGETRLSDAERTSLAGSLEQPGGQAAGLRRFDRAAGTAAPHAVPCDFRWADRLNPDQLRALLSMAHAAARPFAAALSGLARTAIEARVTRVDQLTYAEFVNGLTSATCYCQIAAEPLASPLVLDCGPAVLYPIIDRLLGGAHESAPATDRPLTDIECRLAARVVTLLLDSLRRSWKALLDVEFELARIETDPRAAAYLPPSELAVVISYELSLGATRGAWQLCLPYAALEPIRDRLSDLGRTQPNVPQDVAAAAGVAGETVEVAARLAHVRIAAGELAGLSVGDVITTEQPAERSLVVTIDGKATFHARPGAYKGRKAICVEERVDHSASK